jgi:hypothetical protein
MAATNSTGPSPLVGAPPPPAPGTGRGPLGVPGGTDRSYQVDIIVCAAVTAFIGVIFVAMRFYARGIIINVLDWEDWLILIAQVGTRILCALSGSSFPHISSMIVQVLTGGTALLHWNVYRLCPRYGFLAAPSPFRGGASDFWLTCNTLQRQHWAKGRTHG